MGMMASQIISLTIVNLTVHTGTDQRKTSKLRATGLCAGNSPVTGEFPAQKASNVENVTIWWRHHETHRWFVLLKYSGAILTWHHAMPTNFVKVAIWVHIDMNDVND